MYPNPQNYMIRPAVVRAGQATHMTVLATENSFMFRDHRTYTLHAVPLDEDMTVYFPERKQIEYTVSGGVLEFDFYFEREMRYDFYLGTDKTPLLQVLEVMAVCDDLYELRPLKGDFHGHSYRSDGKQDPAALAGHYREAGYDFFSLTDHNRYYPSREAQAAFKDMPLGITVINGEEVHTPGSIIHVVHVGGRESIDEIYCKQTERYGAELAEARTRVPAELPEEYRERYAKLMWTCESAHRAGGIAIFPHPYWLTPARSYNVCNDFRKRILMSGMFDAYELVGGMTQPGNSMSVASWAELRAEQGLDIAVVGSSDVHGLTGWTFGNLFTVVFAKSNTQKDIIDAVRAKMSVAVERTAFTDHEEFRAYGSLRLVTYAQFLLKNYFSETRRICEGEGYAIRRWLIGEEDGELLRLMAGRVERFSERFFGREEQPRPSAETLAFFKEWHEVHADGPLTKATLLQAELYGDGKKHSRNP